MKTFVLIAILIPGVAAAAFEARSEHYSLSVENSAASAKVVVTDLDSSSPMISEDVRWTPGQPSQIDRKIGDLRFVLKLSRGAGTLTAELEVSRADMQIDLIRTEWSLEPRRLPPPGTLRVGGDVKAPKIIRRVEPVYPDAARKEKIAGIVIIETWLDATGHVVGTIPRRGPPELVPAAVDAVKQWTFEPGTKAGKAVPVVFNLTVNFKLN